MPDLGAPGTAHLGGTQSGRSWVANFRRSWALMNVCRAPSPSLAPPLPGYVRDLFAHLKSRRFCARLVSCLEV